MSDRPGLLSGVDVLLVEDDADARIVFTYALEYCGARVTVVDHPQQAERVMSQFIPAVVVSDFGLPDNGMAVLKAVKARAATLNRAIPVIAVTAYSHLRDRLLAAGYDAFLAKPVDPFLLCDLIYEVIRRPKSSGAS